MRQRDRDFFFSLFSRDSKHSAVNILSTQLVISESTHKGVNQRSKYVTQVQQQRPESPTVTLTWHARKYKDRETGTHTV